MLHGCFSNACSGKSNLNERRANNLQIMSRSEAKGLGLKRYFSGLPCRNGHVCERHTSNGSCSECMSIWAIKNPEKMKVNGLRWRTRNRAFDKERAATWRRENPELARAVTRAWRAENKEMCAARENRRRA